jgi:hypothetical protein
MTEHGSPRIEASQFEMRQIDGSKICVASYSTDYAHLRFQSFQRRYLRRELSTIQYIGLRLDRNELKAHRNLRRRRPDADTATLQFVTSAHPMQIPRPRYPTRMRAAQ